MKRLLLAALIAVAAAPAGADEVVARLSPLPVLDADGAVSGSAEVPFGARLQVLSMDAATVTVADASGDPLRLRAGDVLRLPPDAAALRTDAAAGAGRPDLPLWDSALRARAYLGDPAAAGARPVLALPGSSDLPDLALPVLSAQPVGTTLGTTATLVEVLMPLRPADLATGAGGAGGIMLHVVTDGGDYAAGFARATLDQVSRRLASDEGFGGAALRASRQVIFDTGALRFEGEVPPSRLRAEWPAPEPSDQAGGLGAALADAVARLDEVIRPDDGAVHVILILVGPGLAQDDATGAAAQAAGERLAALRQAGADLRGIVLLQATPEPNPANDLMVQTLSGGVPARSLGFGGDVLGEMQALVAARPQDAADGPDCAGTVAAGLPCLVALDEGAGALAAGTAAGGADWIAAPLWLVAESAPFRILPAGFSAADAAPEQPAIRACLALGQVWAAGLCQPPAIDADGRTQELSRQIADLVARSETAEEALQAAVDDLAAAEEARADLAERLDGALAETGELQSALARAEEEAEAQALRLAAAEDELAALADEARALRDDLAARDAALDEAQVMLDDARRMAGEQAARDAERIAALDGALAEAGAQADAQAEALALAADQLAEERARAAEEAGALEQALADRTAEVDDLTARLAALQAEAAEALAAAESDAAGLRQAVEDRTAEVAALGERLAEAEAAGTAAAAGHAAELAAEQAARQTAEASLQEALARIGTLQERAEALARDAAEGGAADAALVAQIGEEQARRTAAEADLLAEREALAKAREDASAAQEALAMAEAASRDAAGRAAAQVARLEADLSAMAEAGAGLQARADRAEAEVARLMAELAALREGAAAMASTASDSAAPETVVAAGPAPRPRPRPAAPQAVAQAAPPAEPEPAAKPQAEAPAGGLGLLASDGQPAPAARRRVAPAQQAPQLNGCAFQWVGSEGRLVCP
ncbi:MAG: hypothetical protein RIR62_1419 [Pseudomonadota bacterium]